MSTIPGALDGNRPGYCGRSCGRFAFGLLVGSPSPSLCSSSFRQVDLGRIQDHQRSLVVFAFPAGFLKVSCRRLDGLFMECRSLENAGLTEPERGGNLQAVFLVDFQNPFQRDHRGPVFP